MDHVKRNSTGSAADAAGGDRADEITWLDRSLLSGNEDLTLHRPPRCAGLRYVHHQWELFSRDTTHEVYLAQHEDETPLDHQAVQAVAQHVLPVAPARRGDRAPARQGDAQPTTQEQEEGRRSARRGRPHRPEAAADVRAYF